MGGECPLIVIAGPTASGKTSLAVELAREFHGEIISADSRAIYRGLDIGTAKPSMQERRGVPHWGMDIVGPGERFTVVDFQRYAQEKIEEIRSRGHIPFLVGGTGLYIDSVVYAYQFPERVDNQEARKVLEELDIEALHIYCKKNNIKLPENKYNKRYVVNNILRQDRDFKRDKFPRHDAIVVGITTKKIELLNRISVRAVTMWQSGLVAEAQRESQRYGWDSEAMTGNAYRAAHEYCSGILDETLAVERLAVLDRQLAKRQLTWLRRNEHINWLDIHAAHTYIAQVLAACSTSWYDT
jgi:tRNA dimethylallyltransferase